MKNVRMLIVEDDASMMSMLAGAYRSVLVANGFSPAIERATTVADARRLAKAAATNPYDLVSLDVNLGDSLLTGLDVLETLKRFQSAWMVVLLTGVETDDSVARSMGDAKAAALQKQLRRDAYARFPAERLLVVEKPSPTIASADAHQLLSNRLEQIVLVYEEVSRLRFIFRPIEVEAIEKAPGKRGEKRRFLPTRSLHWQIRFNCSDIRTLPDRAGYKTIHKLLSMGPEESLTPEAALVIEPPNEKASPEGQVEDTSIASFFEARGIEWSTHTEQEQAEIANAAVGFHFRRYVELRGYEEDQDIDEREVDELDKIRSELGPLVDIAESAYQRMKPKDPVIGSAGVEIDPIADALAKGEMHIGGGLYTKRAGGRGRDSTESQGFRKRKERVVKYLRENGFVDFADHLEKFIQSTGSNWSYNPPDGVEWTTW